MSRFPNISYSGWCATSDAGFAVGVTVVNVVPLLKTDTNVCTMFVPHDAGAVVGVGAVFPMGSCTL
jgi:hypothetical protein